MPVLGAPSFGGGRNRRVMKPVVDAFTTGIWRPAHAERHHGYFEAKCGLRGVEKLGAQHRQIARRRHLEISSRRAISMILAARPSAWRSTMCAANREIYRRPPAPCAFCRIFRRLKWHLSRYFKLNSGDGWLACQLLSTALLISSCASMRKYRAPERHLPAGENALSPSKLGEAALLPSMRRGNFGRINELFRHVMELVGVAILARAVEISPRRPCMYCCVTEAASAQTKAAHNFDSSAQACVKLCSAENGEKAKFQAGVGRC